MKSDIATWVNECITCIRFRKIPQKQLSEAVISVDAECWEEVMVDLEGPSALLDKDGNRYSFTYVCCLCHGALIERAPVANGRHVRRMFAVCVFRSGRLPNLVRSDRGPELKNLLMQEFCALVGVGKRFGTLWRLIEQGLVEGRVVRARAR